MESRGLFITFEGIDGCGKTTQIELLREYFTKQGKTVIVTREPGAKGLGTKLREILLNYDGEISSNCESFLFLADRAQHIDTIIRPATERGEIVLCDRHTDSTVAYQGYGRQLDLSRIKMLNDIAVNGLYPDLTFVFDIDLETSAKRIGKDKDRMESAGTEFFNRVRNGYKSIALNEPDRVKLIDGSLTVEDISNTIIEHITAYNNKLAVKQ